MSLDGLASLDNRKMSSAALIASKSTRTDDPSRWLKIRVAPPRNSDLAESLITCLVVPMMHIKED